MRKIKSMAEIEKVRRRNNILLGIFMILLLTLSSIGYSLMSAEEESSNVVSDNGFGFIRNGGMWNLVIEEQVFSFKYLPSEISEIENNLSVNLGSYYQQPLYFVSPNEGASEILTNLDRYVLRYQEACVEGKVCNSELPLKSCDSNVIIFEVGEKTEVYQNGGCVFIVGDSVKGSDIFLYKVLGVM